MKWLGMIGIRVLTMLAVTCLVSVARADQLQAWGDDSAHQVSDLPAGSDYVAIAAGDEHGLALTSDGAVVAWGQNGEGQCEVPTGVFTAIGAGAHFSLAIRAGGSVAAWGNDDAGQVSGVTAGTDYVAVDGGLLFAVALRSNGTLVAWGDDRYGQVSDVPPGRDFTAIAAGDGHAVALRSNGSLAAWGYWGAVEETPAIGSYVAISAGDNHCLALTDEGRIVWWGDAPQAHRLDDVPAGKGYVGIAAGYLHDLAIDSDGSAVGWGAGMQTGKQPDLGQADPPAGHLFTAVAGGLYFSVGLIQNPIVHTVADDFDDNRQGAMWSLEADDVSTCWLDEVNERLELRATSAASWASALYFSEGWAVDATQDFSLRIEYRQDAKLGDHTWLSIVLTPDVDNRGSRHVEFGVGSSDSNAYRWIETIDRSVKYSRSAHRAHDSGTLFISYDASVDELYVSEEGYGVENAWATIGDLVQDAWGSQAVSVGIGGGSNRVAIDSGRAYLDNFVFEKGSPTSGQLSAVYRFWSPRLGTHFYTASEAERDRLTKEYPYTWAFEGIGFSAGAVPFDADLAPVYRFWAEKSGVHRYTIDEAEKERLLQQKDIWTFEGVAFYAYPEGRQPPEAQPVYLFSNEVTGGQFYTISVSERNELIKNYPDVLAFRGVGFYAYE